MTNNQDTSSKTEAEALKEAAQNKISTTSDKDALGDSSLEQASGGAWPLNTFSQRTYSPTNGG
jgi:hypothetical protein